MRPIDIPIMHLGVPSPGASALDDALRNDGITIGATSSAMVKAITRLHPDFQPVPTLIIDSAIMDALHPPAVDSWAEWAVNDLDGWVRRLVPPERYDMHRSRIADALPAILRQEERGISVAAIAEELGIPSLAFQRKIRELRRRSTVALGCCFDVWSKRSVLEPFVAWETWTNLRITAVALDYQRIADAAGRVSKIRASDLRSNAWLEQKCLAKLAIPIWLHEQSHASRPGSRDQLEEVSAQLEAFRACSENRDAIFASESFGKALAIPSCSEMIRRLTKEQPPIYGAIFKGLDW